MVKITEGGDEHYTDARGSGRNRNVDASGRRTGQGYLPETFQNPNLDRALGRLGNDPERVIKALRKELAKLPAKERAKAERAIRTRAVKRGGSKKPPKRNRRKGNDGGTPFIDSHNY